MPHVVYRRYDLSENPMTDPREFHRESGHSDDSALDALISLLGDSSRRTVKEARRALLEFGEKARPVLSQAAMAEDARLRARARQALADIDEAYGLRRLRALVARPEVELNEGLDLMDDVLGDGVAWPELRSDVPRRLEEWSRGVGELVAEGESAARVAEALRTVLVHGARFGPPDDDFHHRNHVSIARAIRDRKGLPLTLCSIFALVARSAGFRAGILPFPGQVLLSVGRDGDRVVVDPFEHGRILSRRECNERLDAYWAPSSPLWLEPCTDRQVILRQVRNLAASMDRHRRHGLAETVRSLADDTPWVASGE